MKLEERIAARDNLGPKLIRISGVNGVEAGDYGIVIQVEKKTPEVEKKVEDFLEREAIDLAYVIREVETKIIKLPGSRNYSSERGKTKRKVAV